ncbi:MAG: Ldh family oxidoreductase, partial [Desulfarculaceae bacterium]|nr:Ldh family oxidoreductase [Desulfarculaceae bacterium]
HSPLVIDLSLSKVARGKIMVANQEKQPIPEGWALDSQGKPTTDPQAALAGTMLPMGEAKGAALVLMVEILAAALTGANFGFEASSFFEAQGESPSVGQLLIAMAPGPLSGGLFAQRLETLLDAVLGQAETRLPGDRRLNLREQAQQNGISISQELYEQLTRLSAAQA